MIAEKRIDKDPYENQGELLALIENGDATRILSGSNLVESFNELIKYELITITDGTVCLTDRGRKAMKNGISTVIEQTEMKAAPEVIPAGKAMLTAKKAYTFIFLVLLIFVFLLISLL